MCGGGGSRAPPVLCKVKPSPQQPPPQEVLRVPQVHLLKAQTLRPAVGVSHMFLGIVVPLEPNLRTKIQGHVHGVIISMGWGVHKLWRVHDT